LGQAERRPKIQPEHRRSSGGAPEVVYVAPDHLVWIDVVIGRDDPAWDDDIVRSFLWLGDVWAEALGSLGVADVEVHRGALVRTSLSDLVCFAGLGAGEVSVAGAKVVGLSQRRTSVGARFQTACLLRWDPAPLVRALGLDAAQGDALAHVAGGVAIPGTRLEAAFLRSLATR
jgi:lipoate---protein ligase